MRKGDSKFQGWNPNPGTTKHVKKNDLTEWLWGQEGKNCDPSKAHNSIHPGPWYNTLVEANNRVEHASGSTFLKFFAKGEFKNSEFDTRI